MKRQYRKIEEMEQMVSRYQESGLTLSNFCKEENINEYTFQYWRNKIKNSSSLKRVKSGFRQILPSSFSNSGVIRLNLSGHRVLELPADYPPAHLVQILKELSC